MSDLYSKFHNYIGQLHPCFTFKLYLPENLLSILEQISSNLSQIQTYSIYNQCLGILDRKWDVTENTKYPWVRGSIKSLEYDFGIKNSF